MFDSVSLAFRWPIVCEIADKNCQIVYDLQQNCWDSIDGTAVGGFGVFNFYYDACVGE